MKLSVCPRRALAVVAFGLALAARAPADAHCPWQRFATIDPTPSGNQLNGVSGTAADDVWETGATYEPRRSRGYALHWNGSAWATFAQADRTGHGGQFSGVAALARDDAWLIGQAYTATGYGARVAVAEHWDGEGLRVIPLPSTGAAESFLYGITTSGRADLRAAGGVLASGGLQHAYVVHWDGRTWTRSPAIDVPGGATNLDAIARIAANDVWTVGGTQASPAAPFRTLAEHWDGTRWSVVPTPNVNARSNVFNAVVALSARDVWAIGDYANGRAFTPLAEHWDGTAWHIVPMPDSGSHTAFLFGAAAAGPREVWAVGEIALGGGAVASYILRWDGARWAPAASPNAHDLVTLFNAATVTPDGTAWAVGGTANTRIVIHTFTAVRRCAKELAEINR